MPRNISPRNGSDKNGSDTMRTHEMCSFITAKTATETGDTVCFVIVYTIDL